MPTQSAPRTPRSHSASRSKRSTTDLSNLRLAPLSAKFADQQPTATHHPKTPNEEPIDSTFTRLHSSYLQGRSAPTSPGILSRSNSRKRVGGGLSRKNSIYDQDADDEDTYAYGGAPSIERERVDMGSGQIPKAMSEAALLTSRRDDSGSKASVSPTRRYKYPARRSRTGAVTPRQEPTLAVLDNDWLTHTGATASALVQEGKGQAWMASRDSSTTLRPTESEEDEDDDQYEEMAALSASTANLQLASFDGGSPVSTRASRWGSRYGSRPASRRTSRRASPTGLRTPRPGEGMSYFDMHQLELPSEEPGFRTAEERRAEEEGETSDLGGLGTSKTFGLGSLVDRVMDFNPFTSEEVQESTDDEVGLETEEETQDEARRRRDGEMQRRRDEKAKLVAKPAPAPLGEGADGENEGGGWQDMAWLLSVASKALF
ncbi:unnamed protein product [Zymoseptoria tritici ST99CH_1A5]|uniref:Uncharacterized protein n=3 Tax=Zymoseptoria tritici TaxID=1047171 RepID=A0A1X7S7P7_ZYMT9|nr:unnamed protein product [Zymoseptoria tritici ST99CH_3D7]SMR60895.1 unnamed protein product [Zymoseptoria tritici ST99CH_1E4]SMR64038.1 unnamed protein product [Zymoseptoria tritici ST99CH_3D1]SMY29389.1 unnamed protein product [Zymoseptoria tritici ST99CH_1A5]